MANDHAWDPRELDANSVVDVLTLVTYPQIVSLLPARYVVKEGWRELVMRLGEDCGPPPPPSPKLRIVRII